MTKVAEPVLRRTHARVPGGTISLQVRPSIGAGPGGIPALLVHGVAGSGVQWSRMVDRLSAVRPVAVVDLRGHGGSTSEGAVDSGRQAADLAAVLDELGWKNCHLAGVGFGGAVALRLAAVSPRRVSSLALFGTALRGEPHRLRPALRELWQRGISGFFAPDSPQWGFAPGASPEVLEEAARSCGQIPFPVLSRLLEAACTEDFSRFASVIGCPALVARGEFDLGYPPEVAELVAKALGVHVRGGVRVVADSGPLVMLEAPAEVALMLERFWGGRLS